MSKEITYCLWTSHRINSRDEGFDDYRDSPPVMVLMCGLGPGTILIETSEDGDPCAHVLRYTGTYEEIRQKQSDINSMRWDPWLDEWKDSIK